MVCPNCGTENSAGLRAYLPRYPISVGSGCNAGRVRRADWQSAIQPTGGLRYNGSPIKLIYSFAGFPYLSG